MRSLARNPNKDLLALFLDGDVDLISVIEQGARTIETTFNLVVNRHGNAR